MATGAATRGGYRAALAIPDFRRLAIALSVDAAGSWAYGVVLLVYVFERTSSPTWVAVTSVVRFVPGLLLGAYSGVIAERFERTRVLIGSSLACFASMAAMTVTVALDGPVIVVVALSVVSATVGTPYNPAVGAFVPQLVDEHNLAAANAIQTTIENVATILGPALGGLLLLGHRPSAAFAFNAATFLVSAAFVSRIGTRSTPSDVTEHGAGLISQVTVGFRALKQLPNARLPVLLSVLATFVYGTDTVLFVQMSDHLGGGSSGYGYLLTAEAVGGVAAIAVVNRLASRSSLAWSIGLGMALYCLPNLLIPLLHQMPGGLVIQGVRGLGTLVVDVLALTALQRAVPGHLLSRVLGVFDTLIFAAAAAGALVVPPMLSAFGFTTTLVTIALVVPGIAAFGLPGLRKIDRAAREPVRRLQPVIELLGRLDLFAAASRVDLERLAESATTMKLPADTVVIAEGAVADAFFVVVTGEVVVTSRGESGRDTEVRRLGPDSYFGEIGLLHGIPRTATVRTVTECELVSIAAADFVDALTAAAVSPGLLKTAGRRLAYTHPGLARRTADAAVTP